MVIGESEILNGNVIDAKTTYRTLRTEDGPRFRLLELYNEKKEGPTGVGTHAYSRTTNA